MNKQEALEKINKILNRSFKLCPRNNETVIYEERDNKHESLGIFSKSEKIIEVIKLLRNYIDMCLLEDKEVEEEEIRALVEALKLFTEDQEKIFLIVLCTSLRTYLMQQRKNVNTK